MRTDRNIGKAIGVDYEGSDELRARLTRAGLHEAKRQLDRVNRVAGASGLGGGSRRPTDRQGGYTASDLETNLRQFAQRKTRNGAHWLKLVISR